MVRGRRKRNRIGNLKREDGSWTTNDKEVGIEVAKYYADLFHSNCHINYKEILDGIPESITSQMNASLIKPMEEEEIKDAIFSMNPNKAPRPDEITPLFYQKFWDIVREDVVNAVSSLFHSSHMLKALNHTIISLIPKVDLPIDFKQYRPISLCNVLYKAIFKILANRLKQVLDKCICKNQPAFVPNRQILDNIIISHECLH